MSCSLDKKIFLFRARKSKDLKKNLFKDVESERAQWLGQKDIFLLIINFNSIIFFTFLAKNESNSRIVPKLVNHLLEV